MNIMKLLFPEISEHIKEQSGPPYYCGTPFCGHWTKGDAEKCWQKHCAKAIEGAPDAYAAWDIASSNDLTPDQKASIIRNSRK